MALEIPHLIRLSLVHVVYLGYPASTWYLCIKNADTAGFSSRSALVACVVWYLIHATTQLILFIYGVKEKPIMTKSWFLVYMFCFTLLTMPPYMFTFKMLYDIAETKLSQTIAKHADLANLIHISINEMEYVVFQVAMIILLLTYIVYPFPRRPYDVGAYLALAIEFLNAFDIMDMLGDIAFIRSYDVGWRSVYYVSMGISVLLLSFPINIEEDFVDFPSYFFSLAARLMSSRRGRQNAVNDGMANAGFHIESPEVECVCVVKENHANEAVTAVADSGSLESRTEKLETQERDFTVTKEEVVSKNDKTSTEALDVSPGGPSLDSRLQRKATQDTLIFETWKRILKTAATILFTDVMFAAIRLEIMMVEHSVDHGFNMVVKNLVLAILHSLYLIKHIKTVYLLYRSRLQ